MIEKELLNLLKDGYTTIGKILDRRLEAMRLKEKMGTQKDWEIVSFYQEGFIGLPLYKHGDKYACKIKGTIIPLNESELLKSNIFKIHSVKRLKDGEVFTIGDKTTEGIILKFELTAGTIGFYTDTHNCWNGFGTWGKKVKQPLFTTEDGVNLYSDKDEVFSIERGCFELFHTYYGKSICTYINGWYSQQFNNLTHSAHEHSDAVIKDIKEKFIFFSTKEKAEEYILMNKPCLSLNDLLSVWSSQNQIEFYQQAPLFKSFRKLAEEKINK